MKVKTKPVVIHVQFEENDVVVDNDWFAVGIRRWVGGEHGYLWLVTPRIPHADHDGLNLAHYTDEEMKKFIMDHRFTFVGDHQYLRMSAPQVS